MVNFNLFKKFGLASLILAVMVAGFWMSNFKPGTTNSASKVGAAKVAKYKKDSLYIKFTTGSQAILDANGQFVAADKNSAQQLNALLNNAKKNKAAKAYKSLGNSNAEDAVAANLNNYYRINLAGEIEIESLVTQLKKLPIVQEAYAAPNPAPAPATANFTSLQQYLNSAPVGVGATSVKNLPGANGSAVKIVDVEYSWNTAHEDLTKANGALVAYGTPQDPYNDNNHGTAVLGEMVADDNSFGVTGIAAGSKLALVNAYSSDLGYDLAGSILKASTLMAPGDVLIIEQQAYGPTDSTSDYVPVEWVPAVYDAIKSLTTSGIIVVEPAGNGSQNLDDSTWYGSPFPMGKVDSGAIIVGAGENCNTSNARSRLSFSTYGSRVNLQGPGNCVTSTGYGDLFNGILNALYTQSFSGTSSATPVVAAAAADASSAYKTKTKVSPSPLTIRDMLVRNSTAQDTSIVGNIGPYPDLWKVMIELGLINTSGDTTPPSTPVLSGTLNKNRQPFLTWKASTDNVAVSGYRLYRNGIIYATLSAKTLSYTDTNVNLKSTYYYKLQAFDAAGNSSAFSNEVKIPAK